MAGCANIRIWIENIKPSSLLAQSVGAQCYDVQRLVLIALVKAKRIFAYASMLVKPANTVGLYLKYQNGERDKIGAHFVQGNVKTGISLLLLVATQFVGVVEQQVVEGALAGG